MQKWLLVDRLEHFFKLYDFVNHIPQNQDEPNANIILSYESIYCSAHGSSCPVICPVDHYLSRAAVCYNP